MAERRASEALARARSDRSIARFESKTAYGGAEGVPIREAIVERQGEVVVTRNAYGARCLNVEDVVFADVDFVERERWRGTLPIALTFAVGSVLVAYIAGVDPGFLVCFGLVAMLAGSWLVPRARRAVRAMAGGELALLRRRLARFVRAHPEVRIAVYRTPAGARLLWLHRRAQADDPDVRAFFQAMSVDPMYARMCERQRCFRARLSAKPWRAGFDERIVPRPGAHPLDPSRIAARDAWVARYEAAVAGFAACEFLEEVGSGFAERSIAEVRALHDLRCGVGRGLPLA